MNDDLPARANQTLSGALIKGFPQRGVPPVVTWRCRTRHRLLRVYLTPDGWLLVTEDFRMSPEKWFGRVDTAQLDRPTEAGRKGPPDVGRIGGLHKVLPLDLEEWREGVRFEVGCSDGSKIVVLSDVADDCRRFKSQRSRVERPIDVP